jgi:hypothetical protein
LKAFLQETSLTKLKGKIELAAFPRCSPVSSCSKNAIGHSKRFLSLVEKVVEISDGNLVEYYSVQFYWGFLVPAAGVEPATFRSGGERSNPLSYAGNGVFRKDNTLSTDSQIARIQPELSRSSCSVLQGPTRALPEVL